MIICINVSNDYHFLAPYSTDTMFLVIIMCIIVSEYYYVVCALTFPVIMYIIVSNDYHLTPYSTDSVGCSAQMTKIKQMAG